MGRFLKVLLSAALLWYLLPGVLVVAVALYLAVSL